MKKVSQTNQFARDIKRMIKRGKNPVKLQALVLKLANGESLDIKHRDHPLVGEWNAFRDCHIEPDWILIYSCDAHTLVLQRTGTHSDLFKK
ncbi:MAG: type II toxin-antitoxin system YafQ family toxin [Kiritimatiellia bacterium]